MKLEEIKNIEGLTIEVVKNELDTIFQTPKTDFRLSKDSIFHCPNLAKQDIVIPVKMGEYYVLLTYAKFTVDIRVRIYDVLPVKRFDSHNLSVNINGFVPIDSIHYSKNTQGLNMTLGRKSRLLELLSATTVDETKGFIFSCLFNELRAVSNMLESDNIIYAELDHLFRFGKYNSEKLCVAYYKNKNSIVNRHLLREMTYDKDKVDKISG